jgi:hypothetical protein
VSRILRIMLVLACVFGVVGSASAVKWLNDASYRVQTMGGAGLGIEDETTNLTIFNHENLAGLVLNPKANRLDFGAFYNSESIKQGDYTTTNSDMELTRPGAEYRGLTYWLDDSFAIRAGIEGLSMSSTMKFPAAANMADTTFAFSGLGGGISAAYKMDFGLALGAGVTYTGAGGKPNTLDTIFNVVQAIAFPAAATTTKLEMSANNMDWGVGAAYVLDNLGENNKLSLGLMVGADDDRPNPLALDPTNPNLDVNMFGDFNSVIDVAGTVDFFGTHEVTMKSTYTVTPMKISGEAIFNMGSMLQAGLLFDTKSKDVKVKDEQTMDGVASPAVEYKTMSQNLMGISPVIRANIPLGGANLLPGISFTTYGTGTTDTFGLKTGSTTDSAKVQSDKSTASVISIGVGLQALEKALQLAVQYASGTSKLESTLYDVDSGTTLGTGSAPDLTASTIGAGAEYWVLPIFALRAGYSMHTTSQSIGSTTYKSNSSALTFGAGVNMTNGWNTDLLVKLVTNTQDPAQTPEVTDTAFGVFLGERIPF